MQSTQDNTAHAQDNSGLWSGQWKKGMKESEKGGTEQDKTVEVSSSRHQRSLGETVRPRATDTQAKKKNVGTAATNGNHTREAAKTPRPADSLWSRFRQLINQHNTQVAYF